MYLGHDSLIMHLAHRKNWWLLNQNTIATVHSTLLPTCVICN